MKKTFFLVGMVAVLFGFSVLFSASFAADQPKPIKLKLQVAVPTGSSLFTAYQDLANRIKQLSAGRLEIEILPAGSIVPAFEQLNACSKGVIDASGAWTIYWTGKHPAAGLFYGASGGSFGMDYQDFLGWLFYGGGKELYQRFFDEEIKQNVHVLPTSIGSGPQPLGWFKIPIKSIDDMKKVKWRVGGFAAEVWSSLGSSTVMIPAGEVLPAGERGVIDGAEWVVPAEDIKMGFQDVWKHYLMPGMTEIINNGELLINKEVWNNLAPDLQAIMEVAAMETNVRFLTQLSRNNADALKTLKTKHGVNIERTPKDVLEKYLENWDKIVVPKYAEKYPFFKEVLESQRKWAYYVVPVRAFVEADKLWLTKWYWPQGGVLDLSFEEIFKSSGK